MYGKSLSGARGHLYGSDGSGGGGGVTIQEEDLVPCVKNVRVINVAKKTLVDQGNHSVYLKTGGAGSFLKLDDTPGTFGGMGGKLVSVGSDETGLVFIDPLGSGGTDSGGASATTFLSLRDTPCTYGTDKAGKAVVVNTAGTGLEFADVKGGDGGDDIIAIAALSGLQSYKRAAGKRLVTQAVQFGKNTPTLGCWRIRQEQTGDPLYPNLHFEFWDAAAATWRVVNSFTPPVGSVG